MASFEPSDPTSKYSDHQVFYVYYIAFCTVKETQDRWFGAGPNYWKNHNMKSFLSNDAPRTYKISRKENYYTIIYSSSII